MTRAWAIVLAGGSGTRMAAKGNKVFLPLGGLPCILRTLAPFTALTEGVVLVCRTGEQEQIQQLLTRYGLAGKNIRLVFGGDTRQASVWAGLCAVPEDAESVLVHDGARPLVTVDIIRRVLQSVEKHGSGVAAIPETDTVKRADESGMVLETPRREGLYRMQTPQGFSSALLRRAHQQAQADGYLGTDDASLVERLGEKVYLCEGSPENLKLTTPLDVSLAELILQKRREEEA